MQSESQSGWYKDQSGTVFTTIDGKPPSTVNLPVTRNDGSGQLNNGTWSGTHANPNPTSKP